MATIHSVKRIPDNQRGLTYLVEIEVSYYSLEKANKDDKDRDRLVQELGEKIIQAVSNLN